MCINDRCVCSEGQGYFSQGLFYEFDAGISGSLSPTGRLRVSRVESCASLMLGVSDDLNYYGYVEILRDPGMRQEAFLGVRSQLYVRQIAFIAKKILLLKMKSYRDDEFYWSMINTEGKILNISKPLKQLLIKSDWQAINS